MDQKITKKEWNYILGIPIAILLVMAFGNAIEGTFHIWKFLNNMNEGMGAFIGSGAALSAAVLAASLAHYFSVKREKIKVAKDRVNLILALKAELVSTFSFIVTFKLQVKALLEKISKDPPPDLEFFPHNLTINSFPEGQIISKYPTFIGSLGSNLSVQIFVLKERLLIQMQRFSSPNTTKQSLESATKTIKDLEDVFFNIDKRLVKLALEIIETENLIELENIRKELIWEKNNPMEKRGEKAKKKKTKTKKVKKPSK